MATRSYQVPVIQTSYAKILVQVFTDYGLDLYKLLQDSGLPPGLIESESDFVPSESIKRLIYLTSSQLGVSRFTDVLGLAFKRRIIPYVLHQFTEFETIEDSLKHINTIFSYDSPGSRVDFIQEHGQSWFCRTATEDNSPMFQWGEVFAITYIIELITILSKSPWQPTKVRLQGNDTDIVKTLLSNHCQLFVGHRSTAVLIPDEILQLPIRLTAKDLSNKPAIIEWHTSFTDSVYELLKPYMKEQDLSLEEAAELLNFSVRTFQRKLKNENTTYRKIKENLMFSVACELMEEGHTLTYISSQLGYTNISHFSRAFKRVSGITPKIYQRSISAQTRL
ncbi:helix-turn-helix domain-containing protein [Vibrio cyclitrophicus]|uniref:helix-turn-helix domain-containing protein n=1 Tax=Vibrio cyclitrophicus TaxID=47951 RepID=UPI0003161D5A|nr:helix-turn-helix domain-containing protein [Vibrio cyclitrophicus]NOH45464.1 helix-turn-helix domain-containing protein [Vibrio cyclitrophicus]OBT20336.1 AraC family transcriptional regulator [Vibrio cyclitrophicus]OEF34768.1 AraC family transcriptional regulator [Vibrio cyclitrophicus 1F53]OEF63161.1 AraC family transcriptional regulator [Vibrio cyclitrophicus 1F175]OEF64264.1 AraC family transcriptional regulator [Vibrio cyclitrophicus 1F175]